MSSIDEEVRRAEQMALAVASAPNLRASEAKMLSKSQSNINTSLSFTKKVKSSVTRRRRRRIETSVWTTERRQQPQKHKGGGATNIPTQMKLQQNTATAAKALDSADEEVRRAHEMALAVAALGTEKGAMKAEDIRMAVADVVTMTTEKNRKNKQQQKVTKSSPKKQQQQDGKTSDGDSDDRKSDSRVQTIMDDMLRPPWILRNQNLLAMIVLANLLIVYVTLSPAPSFTKLSNAVFIFNTAVSFFCVVEKSNNEDINITSAIEDQTNADAKDAAIVDDEENLKSQEALVNEMEKRLRPENSITLEWLPDVQYREVDLQSLLDLQPESTLAERRRFLKARKGVIKAASAQLGSYIQWRFQNKIDEFFPSTFTTDEEDWALAARGAMEIANTSPTSPASQKILPRVVSVFGGNDGLVLCKNGARIVHVLPSQLDTNLAPAKTYALALAMYLDRKLDRNHTEKVTVVIDIRSGTGWPNPSSVSLVPFIKLVVGSLNSYFPERLSRCILFPLPMTATVLFNKAKAYLDPDTATKIQVCSGAGSVKSAVPAKVKNFIDYKSIDAMERRRKELFVQ